MGSIVMHLCISEKIRKKYNYSDMFLVGSLLPDIYKRTVMTRDESHYIKKIINDGQQIKVPNLEKFMEANKDKKQEEVVLGYLAHLVEDYIWFKDFSAKKVRLIKEDEDDEDKDLYTYRKEDFKITHPESEMKIEVYNDYSALNDIGLKLIPIDLAKVRETCNHFFDNEEKYMQVISEDIKNFKPVPGRENFFYSEEDLKEYVNQSEKKVEEYLEKFKTL